MQVAEGCNAVSFGARVPAGQSGLELPVQEFHGQMGAIYLFEDLLTPGPPLAFPQLPSCITAHPCAQSVPADCQANLGSNLKPAWW